MNAHDGSRRVKFGDVVRNVSESVADPFSVGLKRAVGLEHIEPNELAVTRWASTGDGLTFTRRFRAGQVLFGRRRAYQRKVAIPDFDGVCSGDIYVLEPRDEQLTAELLPFIVQSEPFFRYALRTSAGSLSPRTKWSDLQNYEFDLSPINEQREIGTLLWAVEAARRSWNSVEDSLFEARARYFDELVAEALPPTVRLGELLTSVQYGTSKRCSEDHEDGDKPVLRIPNVMSGRLDLADLKWARFTPDEFDKYRVERGDVLVVRTNGNPKYVGRGVTVENRVPSGSVFASYLIRLRTKSDLLDPGFLGAMLDAPGFRAALRPSIRSSAGNFNLNSENIRRQPIRLPTLVTQRAILERIALFDQQRLTVGEQITRLDIVKQALVAAFITSP